MPRSVETTPISEILIPESFAIGLAGQGATTTQAGMNWYKNSPCAREIFHRADDFLKKELDGFSLIKLWMDESEEAQTKARETFYTHLLNTTVMVAKYEGLREKFGQRDISYILPQSAGECAALAISGVLEFEDALSIAKKRGELTTKVGQQTEGEMFYLQGLGLSIDQLKEVCLFASASVGGFVDVSNINSPDHTIISGHKMTANEAIRILEQIKITDKKGVEHKAIRFAKDLGIGYASHVPLMDPTVVPFLEFIQKTKETSCVKNSQFPWISNGKKYINGHEIMDLIVVNPVVMVDYKSSGELLLDEGEKVMVELTPNRQNRMVVGRYMESISKAAGTDFLTIPV